MRVLRRVTSGFFRYALAISKARAVARPSGTTSVTAPHSLAVAADMGLGSNNIASARVGPTRYDQAVKMPSPGTMPPAKWAASRDIRMPSYLLKYAGSAAWLALAASMEAAAAAVTAEARRAPTKED